MASKIDRAKTQLIVNHPFFASVLLRKPLTVTDQIPTAAINASGHIFVGSEFIKPLTVDQVVFLLAHECMHWIMDTFGRMDGKDLKQWNIATDAVNNELLIESGVGEFIEGGVRWSGAQNMTADEIYHQLQQGKQPEGGGGNSSGGSGDSSQDIGGTGQDIDPTGDSGTAPTAAERAASQAALKVELAEAMTAAKQMGSMPAGIARIVEGLLHVPTPWHEKLERFMFEKIRSGYSWTRPNRRFASLGIYLPSRESQGLGEVPIVVDTSGSISKAEFNAFVSHTSAILESANPQAAHVIYVDAAVNRVDTFSADELPIKVDAKGGGGTDMRIGIEYAAKEYPDAPCVIVLTDGYTPWPERCDLPMVVVTTGLTCDTPGAENIKIEL